MAFKNLALTVVGLNLSGLIGERKEVESYRLRWSLEKRSLPKHRERSLKAGMYPINGTHASTATSYFVRAYLSLKS